MDLIQELDTFCIQHMHITQNKVANELAQQASGYGVTRGWFIAKLKPTSYITEDVNARDSESAAEDKIVLGDWRHIL
jgi:hypothetical protein